MDSSATLLQSVAKALSIIYYHSVILFVLDRMSVLKGWTVLRHGPKKLAA